MRPPAAVSPVRGHQLAHSLLVRACCGGADAATARCQFGGDGPGRCRGRAAGVGVAVCARVPACHVCARHRMHGDVCTQSCASVLLCRGSSVRRGRARDGDGTHMHARPRHAPADTPARFSGAELPSTTPNTAVMRSRRRRSRQRCASTGPSIRSFMRLRRAWSSWWRT
jgi:hypothetical protein